jgi:hypothetical protein
MTYREPHQSTPNISFQANNLEHGNGTDVHYGNPLRINFHRDEIRTLGLSDIYHGCKKTTSRRSVFIVFDCQ